MRTLYASFLLALTVMANQPLATAVVMLSILGLADLAGWGLGTAATCGVLVPVVLLTGYGFYRLSVRQ